MPFIKAKVSCSISQEQESELKTSIGKAIELVPGAYCGGQRPLVRS